MAVTYATVLQISQRIRGRYVPPVLLAANSGVSEANKDRVQVGNTGPFTVGDEVRITSDTNNNTRVGEDRTISTITANQYITVNSDLAFDYLIAQKAQVQIKSMFSTMSQPDIETVEQYINEAEEEIDDKTNHSWLTDGRTVTQEYYDIDAQYLTLTGIPVQIKHREIKAFDTAKGDILEIWDGSNWIDWITARTEDRNNDFWIPTASGILYLRLWFIPYKTFAVRITYRYGGATVPKDIQKATIHLAAADVLDNENFASKLPGGDNLNIIPTDQKQKNWRALAKSTIRARREITSLKFNG